ncbi:selenocysteine-specific translation elongation factor [Helicobacter sp. MIT 14-3879]|uniref:selenocysteine-specific translation elongation factor n=1 Tax=Helicobacter sp. MIT 14-3879 TaxID=2040649 RepID=UPI0015F14B5E|nr:selenocysteine-specific translation elongation factor [Helicobacter sp. MIT 14-3879]
MRSVIIGLSGHIDHGKTSFIKAINNYDGDLRADEIERGMTIDISFSNMITLDKQISFIDVPGHEKLVKNMISGAFGIDVLALIVALDDSLMPQSIEHLYIAKLLGIKRIIIFLTKYDLVTKNRVDFVRNEVKNFVNDLGFDIEGIYNFSIYNQDLIQEAKSVLLNLESNKIDKSPFFRYYCDRVFSKKGFGTIVTGTILSGSIIKNDKVFICDLNKEVLIKSIHNHNRELDSAIFGERIALALSNISQCDIKKGYLLSKKGILRKFSRIDCVIFPLQDIKNNQNAVFFIGSKRLNASINILKKYNDKIFASLNLDDGIFGVFREHFILRDNSKTIGGGYILNPISDPMRKEQKIKYLEYLFNNNFKFAFKLLIDAHNRGFGLIQSPQRFNLTHKESLNIAKDIAKDNGIFVDDENLVVYSLKVRDEIKNTILNLINKNKNAIFSANSINSELKWSSSSFTQSILDILLQENRIQKKQNNLYISIESNIKDIFSYTRDSIIKELEISDLTPQAPYNIYDKLNIDRKFGDSIFKDLTKTKKVVRLSHNVFILTSSLNKVMEHFREIIKKEGYIDIVIARKYYNISRKYIICYLDYLDKFGDIYKEETKRKFKNAN